MGCFSPSLLSGLLDSGRVEGRDVTKPEAGWDAVNMAARGILRRGMSAWAFMRTTIYHRFHQILFVEHRLHIVDARRRNGVESRVFLRRRDGNPEISRLQKAPYIFSVIQRRLVPIFQHCVYFPHRQKIQKAVSP